MFQSELRRTIPGFTLRLFWDFHLGGTTMSVDQIARWGFVALVAATFNNSVLASELPSHATLQAMGLGDLQIMTDEEGLSVRGMGALAYGQSFAAVSGPGAAASSVNGYLSQGSHSAAGKNLSFAGIEVQISSGDNGDDGGGYGN